MLRSGKPKEAEILFRRMLAGGLKPNGLNSRTIIRRLCQQSGVLDGYQLTDVVELSSIDSDVYSILMAELCEAKHLIEAVKLASVMVGKGTQLKGPSVENVIVCLRCYGKEDLASSIGNIKSCREDLASRIGHLAIEIDRQLYGTLHLIESFSFVQSIGKKGAASFVQSIKTDRCTKFPLCTESDKGPTIFKA